VKTDKPDRFFELAMMKIAGQASAYELEGLLSQDPGLEQEFKRLAQESRLMIKLIPMIREAQTTR